MLTRDRVVEYMDHVGWADARLEPHFSGLLVYNVSECFDVWSLRSRLVNAMAAAAFGKVPISLSMIRGSIAHRHILGFLSRRLMDEGYSVSTECYLIVRGERVAVASKTDLEVYDKARNGEYHVLEIKTYESPNSWMSRERAVEQLRGYAKFHRHGSGGCVGYHAVTVGPNFEISVASEIGVQDVEPVHSVSQEDEDSILALMRTAAEDIWSQLQVDVSLKRPDWWTRLMFKIDTHLCRDDGCRIGLSYLRSFVSERGGIDFLMDLYRYRVVIEDEVLKL